MKSKKLTSTRPKVKLDKEWLQDKENKCSMDEYPFKKRSVDLQKRSIDQQKTSVDLHKYSYETDLRLGHRKSIMNEEISVFLNHSRKKLVTAGRQPLQEDIQCISQALADNNHLSIAEILADALPELKTEQARELVGYLLKKVEDQVESTDSFTCIEEEYRSFSLKNTCLRQYIEQEIEMLEHSHHRLLHRKKELEEIKGVSVDQKVAILKALKAIEEDQQRELVMLAYE